MVNCDVLIVGGGPAGAACAGKLKSSGLDCLVLDQRVFPRFKPCAGWITPHVLRALEIRPEEYPFGLTRFRTFDIALGKFKFRTPTHQYAIRRFEFDEWLLRRSGAPLIQHAVRQIEETPQGYIVDGEYCAPYLVGAGGTHCPVGRALFEPFTPRSKADLIVALEEEFPYACPDQRCRLWFFEEGLPGYSWYVPKMGGWLNVGIGAKEQDLKASGKTLRAYWESLLVRLERDGLVRGHEFKPAGHSYYLRRPGAAPRRGNAFLVGDAAGLATSDMGEGIGPAIQSGIRAAEAIAQGSEYRLDFIPRYSLKSLLGF